MWGMSLKDKVLKQEMEEILVDMKNLRESKKKIEEEVEMLKLKKRLEVEEIKHLTKINEERLKSELEREKIMLQEKYAKDITVFREEQRVELIESLKSFHSKIEQRFDSELANLKETYKAIMERLPNVNFEISKHMGDPKFIELGKKGE